MAESVRKDTARGEKGFSRLAEASVGLQQPVKCCPFSPNTDKPTANWKVQD